MNTQFALVGYDKLSTLRLHMNIVFCTNRVVLHGSIPSWSAVLFGTYTLVAGGLPALLSVFLFAHRSVFCVRLIRVWTVFLTKKCLHTGHTFIARSCEFVCVLQARKRW